MQISLEMAVPIIERSILFDEHWYRKMYRLDTQTNAAEHYLMEGYKKGWNPSKYFSTEEYFLENPDVRWGGTPPLLHYEVIGHRAGRYSEHIPKGILQRYRKCACCGNYVSRYFPLPSYFIEEGRKYGAKSWKSEMVNMSDYSCPWCGSADRERAYAIWMKRELGAEFSGNILDIAPAPTLSRFIHENFPKADYKTADLYMKDVDYHMDIMDMNCLENESIDFFICSHVLEHVRDDRKAMCELHRVLKKTGCGILVVPIDLNQLKIDEDPDCTDVGERWRRFGQNDHVRKYSREGYLNRLKEAGFRVLQYQKEYFGTQAMYENALTETATVYIVAKQE